MIPRPNVPVKPEEFIGRKEQIDSFRSTLQQGLETGVVTSMAILGDWGIGKSSLLLKLAAICSEPEYGILPVFYSVSKELGDYQRFAENLLDKFAVTLATSSSLASLFRSEFDNWKLKRISVAGFQLDREAPQFFLSSGTGLLSHALADAWKSFLKPSGVNGVIFFLDDLHNLAAPDPEAVALILRDQFQSFAIERLNYSVCFSGPTDYFSNIRSFAEPAVRFYSKFYLAPFTLDETAEYTQAAFGLRDQKSLRLAHWLYEKTLGHPYFLTFISRQLLVLAQGSPPESPEPFWPHIFNQLGLEKFRPDLARLSQRDVQLLRALAKADSDEVGPRELRPPINRAYFHRLTERGLLVRTA